ncbi:odorant receptor 67c-like [Diachasma alloeum]|uniref:Odorant receptor n=1 Tax=Diachasma alloeum TaxID=454923 RepID=A0A4E0RJV7_9HYME|nr:odorant receptor 67c-like [Diachasma alloeum]THK33032.1 odorant receptor 5 [Diachasma alloeum]
MRDEFAVLGTVPAPSERSKDDMKYSTELNRWFLTPIGIWSTRSDAHIIEKILSELLVFLSCFLICFLLVPCGLHTFIKEQDPKLKMKMIGPLSFCLMSITKYLLLVARRREIRHCLEHIDIDWRRVRYLDDREIMMMNAKLGRFIACLCAVFMYGGGFFYHTIMPFAAGSFVTPDNITIRPLVYAIYDPLFSAQTTPAYEIVFTIQWFSGFVNYSVTIGACSLAAVFVLHICGQLKIVSSRLESFVKGRTDERKNVESRMAEIIELHLRALGFVVRVEGILNEICLIEFVGCTMNICFLGYYFMTEFEQSAAIATVTYCVLLVSFTFNIFIFCYIGEMLTQQGDKVGRTAYMIKWYELPAKSARGLILLLAMTKNPASITAGKMAELSFRSFCGVLKTAAAYLNLLRTVVM